MCPRFAGVYIVLPVACLAAGSWGRFAAARNSPECTWCKGNIYPPPIGLRRKCCTFLEQGVENGTFLFLGFHFVAFARPAFSNNEDLRESALTREPKGRYVFYWGGGGGRGGGGVGWGFLGVSFLKSWPSPLDQQKKSMTLHKRWPKNMWPSPAPLNPSWYYWSLLTRCLCIVTHCHNTVAKRWISLSTYVIKLSSNVVPATLRTNITFVFFCQGAHRAVNFNSERKCCGVDQMFLKNVANAQLVLRVSCPNWERFVRNWQWSECACGGMEWRTHV